ncbi:MAG TPA: beta-galactosidase trimerization domain-containing protein [Chthoniobacteraceae bacterium]|nr:beta-galactosidase trimerization domain-containing protein [Chthoniobacteraceae bacterium]
MMNSVCCRWLPVLFAFAVGLFNACAGEENRLNLKPGALLEVEWNGQPLITADTLSLADFSKAEFEEAASKSARVGVLKGGGPADVAYYRETAQNGDTVEVTLYAKYPSWNYGAARRQPLPDGAGYEIRMAAAPFEGGRFKALGTSYRSAPGEVEEGNIPDTTAVVAREISYLVLWTREGSPVAFDLNPKGLSAMAHYLQAQKEWRLSREGDELVLRAMFGAIDWGDTREFKVIIRPRGWEFEARHATNRRNYIYLHPERQFSFGAAGKRKGFENIDTKAYPSGNGAGWLTPESLLKGKGSLGPHALNSYIEAPTPAPQTFRVDLPDGLYLVNAALSGRGALSVAVAGKEKIAHAELMENRLTALTTYGWVKDGKLEVTFSGEAWRLHGLSFSLLVRPQEDYFFHRTWWLAPERFEAWHSTVEPLVDLAPCPVPEAVADRMAWAWNASINTLEGSINKSSRTALDTPEAVAARIDEIKEDGYGVVVINGAHFRFNLIDSTRAAVIRRNTRMAVEAAHGRGMKIFLHLDLNWIFYNGIPKMLEMVENDPDLLQRNVFNPLDVQANFCLLSPRFFAQVEAYLRTVQKETGVDGYMIDELTYDGDSHAGSDRFRALFRERFGRELPYDAAGFLQEPTNPLWRDYVRLRGDIRADFTDRLIASLRTLHPNVILLGYTSLDLSGPTPVRYGLEEGMPKRFDYFGDEFHPDDIVQNWRVATMRLKERQGVAASWQSGPTWILPKVGPNPDQMLYAWALARMNRANSWLRTSGADGGLRTANRWPWQMNDARSVPYSDLAVLLSERTAQVTASSDEGRAYYNREFGGWLQTLADENLQYDVVIERDLTLGALDRYKALILPNAAALTSEAVAAIRAFADRGGMVVASYETGKLDGEGNPREVFALAQAMNLEQPSPRRAGAALELKLPSPQAKATPVKLETRVPQLAWKLADPQRSEVLAWSRAEGDSWPAIVKTRHGNGSLIYLAGNFLARNYEERVAARGSRTTLAKRGATRYRGDRDPALNVVVKQLFEREIGGRLATRPVRVPRKVIYTAFVEKQDDGGDAIVLQLLNLQGRPDLKPGEEVVKLAPVPRPPLAEDLEIAVRSEIPIEGGVIAAMGRPKPTPVGVKAEAGGSYLISIPREALRDYAVVRLNRKTAPTLSSSRP